MHCARHNIFFQGKKCQKCIDKESPYLYSRDEVPDTKEWARYVRLGWVL